MRQVLQDLRSGRIELAEVPCPRPGPNELLIRTTASVLSPGTERMLLEFGRAGWVGKARQQPERVRQVLEKVRTDGLAAAVRAVRSRLDQPLALGYSNCGFVVDRGRGVDGFAVGQRVASNGPHAELVVVPQTLCAPVPQGLSDEEAAFTVLGAVALQGIRLAQPGLGESVAVMGLGLIGQMAVQLLRAHGCRVLASDPDPRRLELASRFGAEVVDLSTGADQVEAAMRFSRCRGMDAVLITASTPSSDPVHQAAQMCRKRGRVVLVGVTGLELRRGDFYEKELTLQVSCSYGPGRYDPAYEEKGHDYPVGFVRWTARRNMEAVLDMLAEGRLQVGPLITHRFMLEEAERAYEAVVGQGHALGVLLEYPAGQAQAEAARRTVALQPPKVASGKGVAFIGAGGHATGILLPAFCASGARIRAVASRTGRSAAQAARRFGAEGATTDLEEIWGDPEVEAVVIATRHDTHAGLVLRALEAGKHVFVEKPLCMTREELDRIETTYRGLSCRGEAPVLMVGFNRRFAPVVGKMASLLKGLAGPKALIVTVNAGALPPEHWAHDPQVGGGRILGEACHYVDLLRHLVGHPIRLAQRFDLASPPGDSATLELLFADGSLGTVHYLTNGSKAFPKERVEAFAGGRVLQLENFRVLRGWGWPGFGRQRLWRQDKGHRGCVEAFLEAMEEQRMPIPFEEMLEVHRAVLDLARPEG